MDFSKKVAITVALIIVIGGLIILFSKTSGDFMNGIWEWVFDEVFDTKPPKNPFRPGGTSSMVIPSAMNQLAVTDLGSTVVLS